MLSERRLLKQLLLYFKKSYIKPEVIKERYYYVKWYKLFIAYSFVIYIRVN